jgi:hypothetical protein
MVILCENKIYSNNSDNFMKMICKESYEYDWGLYRGSQFYFGGEHHSTRRKPSTCMPQVTDKLFHIMLYRVIPCLSGELTTLVVIGTDCIDSCKSKTTMRSRPGQFVDSSKRKIENMTIVFMFRWWTQSNCYAFLYLCVKHQYQRNTSYLGHITSRRVSYKRHDLPLPF